MPRVKTGIVRRRRHNKVLKACKGYFSGRHRLIRTAKTAVMRAGMSAWRDRRRKKRLYRALWIARINAAARQRGVTYSKLAGALRKADIRLNRPMLAHLALEDPQAFDAVVEKALAGG
jgi:large subunit ribosomal protein L20